MCYNVSIFKSMSVLEAHFNAAYIEKEEFKPIYHVSSFTIPTLPVITNDKPDYIQLLNWGLIPFWVKNNNQMEEIRLKTMNARAETIYEKPAFRQSAKQNHCLVLIDGFFEWREFQGSNYPYYIRLKNKKPFALAGLWDSWVNKESDEKFKTFSIITTNANPLLEKIHNKKKRMPVILNHEDESLWINNTLEEDEAKKLLIPFDENELEAYTISKLITNKIRDTNVPEVIKPHNYPELANTDEKQTKLF